MGKVQKAINSVGFDGVTPAITYAELNTAIDADTIIKPP